MAELSKTRQSEQSGRDRQKNQDKIWDYFQNVSPEAFRAGKPRLDFILRQVFRKKIKIAQSVLNIGVGDGYLEKALLRRGFDVYSLDPSEDAIQGIVKSGIHGQVGVIEAMPFEHNQFDFVIASR